MIIESAYNLICSNLEGPQDIEIWQNNVGISFQDSLNYIERGLTEEQALSEEITAYQHSSYKNATALFCAFQIVKQHYLRARRVDPNDIQKEG